MIVDDRGGELVLVEQEAHAQLTGELAAHLPFVLPAHGAFVAAARVHDNGWREADEAATVDDDGVPHTFTTVPDDTYEAVWRRGIERAADVDAFVGLLVGLHGARFFESRRSEGMRSLVEEERQREDRVLAELGLGGSWAAPPTEVGEASDWIAMLDALSLMLCGAPLPDRISPRVAGTPYTLTRMNDGVTIDPWPYGRRLLGVGALELEVAARPIPPGPYASDAALRAALAEAAPSRIPGVVRPAS